MKSPDWLTGSAPMPKHECDKEDCGNTDIKFHFLEKTGAVWKCCYVCWTSRAVSKRLFAKEARGWYSEYQLVYKAHRLEEWERKRHERAKLEQEALGESFYDTQAWKSVAFKARLDNYKKHGRKCVLCGRSDLPLHMDHIKPRSKYPELALDPTNLQVLCEMCNQGKSNRDETDFREPA